MTAEERGREAANAIFRINLRKKASRAAPRAAEKGTELRQTEGQGLRPSGGESGNFSRTGSKPGGQKAAAFAGLREQGALCKPDL